MFVWWAVFFFAGTFFSSGASGAAAAAAVSIFLVFRFGYRYPVVWQRAFLTCSSGILVFLAASLQPADITVLNGTGGAVRRRAVYFRPVSEVRERIHAITGSGSLDERTRGLLRALLIADRRSISAGDRRNWSATGTAHYLALSGLHLGLIAVPLFGILTLAGARGIVRDAAALFALSFYAAVAGSPGSLLRALSMMTVLRLYRLAGIRIDLARCVITGAFLVCLLDRRSLEDTGFLLSFNAAAGVALLGIPVCGYLQDRMSGPVWKRIMRFPVQSVAMSFSVQISMLPLSVRIFGFAPVAGPVMSVMLALPVTALLYGGFIYVSAGYYLGSASALPLNLVSGIASGLVAFGADRTWPGIVISDFNTPLYIAALAVSAIGLRAGKGCARLLAAGSLMAIVSFTPGFISGGGTDHHANAGFPGHGARLYGGRDGILVLDGSPQEWSAPALVRDIRKSGVRSIYCAVILDPGDLSAAGMDLVTRDLGIGLVLVSPWAEGACIESRGWRAVREDTLLHAGGSRLKISPPPVPPGKGARASGRDACLVISLLD
jgi:ComEC/Rec2-related protein